VAPFPSAEIESPQLELSAPSSTSVPVSRWPKCRVLRNVETKLGIVYVIFRHWRRVFKECVSAPMRVTGRRCPASQRRERAKPTVPPAPTRRTVFFANAVK
jgi:hypothetical protein